MDKLSLDDKWRLRKVIESAQQSYDDKIIWGVNTTLVDEITEKIEESTFLAFYHF